MVIKGRVYGKLSLDYGKCGMHVSKHSGSVLSVALSPDGSHIRVVHGSHFWLIFKLIFGSFSCSIWQRNKQKGIKNDAKNDVKNGYREHPGKENLEKWSKNAFFPPGTLPKR